MDYIDKLLEVKAPRKTRTSFNLDVDQYSLLKRFCKSKGLIPSDILNALIKEFNIKVSKGVYGGSEDGSPRRVEGGDGI